MKHKIFSLFFLVLVTTTFSTSLHAEDLQNRKGFFLGFGPYVGGEVNRIDQIIGGLEFRIGGGLTDKTLLFVENNGIYTHKDYVNYVAYDLQLKIQQFLYEGLYINVGSGLSVGNANFAGISLATKVGFGVSSGLGYEFRVGKSFAISPEAAFYYRRLDGLSYIVPAAILNMSWYF